MRPWRIEDYSHPAVSAFVSDLRQAQFRSGMAVHESLTMRGFRLVAKKRVGLLVEGVMLLYVSPFAWTNGFGLIVRIKTRGAGAGRKRAFVPHLSVAWVEGWPTPRSPSMSLKKADERCMYDATGVPEPTMPSDWEREEEMDAWADRTHLSFADPGFLYDLELLEPEETSPRGHC